MKYVGALFVAGLAAAVVWVVCVCPVNAFVR